MKHSIMEMPTSSLPRERLVEYGVKSLATHELLAILLRTGTKSENVVQLSLHILHHFEDLYALKMASLDELMAIKGIGKIKAIELKAAIELGLRLNEANQIKKGRILSVQMAGKLLRMELKDEYQEHLIAFFLNSKNEVIEKKTIFVGSLNTSVAHPREIFRCAVRVSAARVLIGHNHPSGNLTPSSADIEFTKRLQNSGELIGIELLDHVIVGADGYLSLREEGYIT